MIRLIAFAAFALAVTTSAQAMTVAPVHEPDGMITQVAYGCGPGRTRVGGVCVARTSIQDQRAAMPASRTLRCGTLSLRRRRRAPWG